MQIPILSRILCFVLGLILIMSCGFQTALKHPRATPKNTLPEPIHTLLATQRFTTVQPPLPSPQSHKLVQPSRTFTLLLGRPTITSITASLLSNTAQQLMIVYGKQSGIYTQQTDSITLQANIPQIIEITQLEPNTAYYYKIIGNSTSVGEYTFHTQRSPGSTFTFTIDADPHNRDQRFNSTLYALTLNNVLNDHPDFHINLGDTFMTEKAKPQTYAEVMSTFSEVRPYFGIIGMDVPLFLVNGNHEGELGWLLAKKGDRNLPIWSTQARHLYYPNPTPNEFYSGSSMLDESLGSVRDGYYAWTWGDGIFIVLDPYWYTSKKPKPDAPDNYWNWTLGKDQYYWLKSTLETSTAKYKFIFIHHLVGGAELNGSARGGIEYANLYEWGGYNADGTYGFDEQRSGWGKPIHQLLVENKTTVVFHGHDHVFVKQDLDGIVYQECPQPSNADNNNTRLAVEYGYSHGEIFSSSGNLRIIVKPERVTVAYVRAFLADDNKNSQHDGQVDYSYTIE